MPGELPLNTRGLDSAIETQNSQIEPDASSH